MTTGKTPFWMMSNSKDGHPAKKEHHLYKKWRRVAESTKIVFQFAVGIVLAILLIAKAFVSFFPQWNVPFWLRAEELRGLPTLELVAIALEYSAGFELAYTLFTEGPDEAVEPVIMGLAAAMLLGFSKLGSTDLPAGLGAIAFVVALAGLFLIRHYFVEPNPDHDDAKSRQ